jgi:hypothetical protein
LGWRSARLLAISAALTLSTQPAFAHDAFGTMGPFWFGALHVAVSALAVAALIGFGATLVSVAKPFVFPALVVGAVVAAAATSAGISLVDYGSIGAIAAGVTAAAGRVIPPTAAIAIAVVAGFGTGISAEVDTPSVAAAVGAAFAAFLFAGLSYGVFARVDGALPFARRVAGAWVAAIGLLIAALTLLR